MSWSDDDWGKPIFPTRFGSPQGHATERKMLDAVGGFDGIRTKIRTNPDGSITILKTRGGMPVFITSEIKPNEKNRKAIGRDKQPAHDGASKEQQRSAQPHNLDRQKVKRDAVDSRA